MVPLSLDRASQSPAGENASEWMSARSVPRLSSIKGDPPNLVNPPAGCGFCPRCDDRIAGCETEHPGLVEVERGHFVRCLLAKGGV